MLTSEAGNGMLCSKYIMTLLQEAYDNINVICNSSVNIIISCCYRNGLTSTVSCS